MEGAADVQQNDTLCAGFFQFYKSCLYCWCLTGNHNLSRTVVIGNRHVARLNLPAVLAAGLSCQSFKHLFNPGRLKPHYRTHPAFTGRHRVLHKDSPLTHQPDGIQILHPACRSNGTVFTKA